jgi:hypothetical protein
MERLLLENCRAEELAHTIQKNHKKVTTRGMGGEGARVQGLAERGKRRSRGWTKGQRKGGVKREKNRSNPKKSTKILLTRKCGSHDTPIAPVTVFPL